MTCETGPFRVLDGANSHCFDKRIVFGEGDAAAIEDVGKCIAFADEPWASRIVEALTALAHPVNDEIELAPAHPGALVRSITVVDQFIDSDDGEILTPEVAESIMLAMHELKRLRLAHPAAAEAQAQRMGEERLYPKRLSSDEAKALLSRAENLWTDLQSNNLGGFSGINRPFWIVHEFRHVIEEFGHRDVGLHWSKDQLDAASTDAAQMQGGGV